MVTNKHILAKGEELGPRGGEQKIRISKKRFNSNYKVLRDQIQPPSLILSCTMLTLQPHMLSFSSPLIPVPSYLRAFAHDIPSVMSILPISPSLGSLLSSFPSQPSNLPGEAFPDLPAQMRFSCHKFS